MMSEKLDTNNAVREEEIELVPVPFSRDVEYSFNSLLGRGYRYNHAQALQIKNGLRTNLDISKYSDPKFTAEQMLEIRYGLVYRVNVDTYTNPVFSSDQMRLIRYGLMCNLDVTQYAKEEYNFAQMEQIKESMEESLYPDKPSLVDTMPSSLTVM